MRTLLLIVLCLLAGAGGSLYLDRSPVWRPVIDNMIAPALSVIPNAKRPDDGVSDALLQSLSMLPCYSRNAAFNDMPPSWMTRDELGPLSAQALPKRDYPDLRQMPGLVKLEQILSTGGTQKHHCAATRIGRNWFATANHCVMMRGAATLVVDMVIVAPANDVMQPDTIIVPATAAICHWAWYNSTGKFDDDVALIYVEDVSRLDHVQIATMDSAAAPLPPSDYQNAYFAGWGKNGENRFLQGGRVSVTEIGETFIEVDNSGQFSPCVGDSGGPLYLYRDGQPRVVGVLSSVTTDACPPFGIAFYMRLKTYEDWVRHVMIMCIREGEFVCLPETDRA